VKLKNFFQPRWYVYSILIAISIIEFFFLLPGTFGRWGGGGCLTCKNTGPLIFSYDWFVLIGMFLIPIVLIYILISVIVLIVDKIKK